MQFNYTLSRRSFVDVLHDYDLWKQKHTAQKKLFLNEHKQRLLPSTLHSLWFLLRSLTLCYVPLILIVFFHPHYSISFVLAFISGLSFCSLISVMHDAVHHSLFRNAFANDLVGLLIELCFPFSYYRFKDGHLSHHKYSQSLADPKVPMIYLLNSRFDRDDPSSMADEIQKVDPEYNLFWLLMWRITSWLHAKPFFISQIIVFSTLFLFAPIYILFIGGEFSLIRIKDIGFFVLFIGKITAWMIIFSLSGILGWYLLAMWIGFFAVSFIFISHLNPINIAPMNTYSPTALLDFNIVNISMGSLLNWLIGNFTCLHIEHHVFTWVPSYNLSKITPMLRNDQYSSLYHSICLFSLKDLKWFIPETMKHFCGRPGLDFHFFTIQGITYRIGGMKNMS